MTNVISSSNNAIVKKINSLKLSKNRRKTKLFIVEGLKMAKEALDSKIEIENIILDEDIVFPIKKEYENRVIRLKNSLFKDVSDLMNPEGIMLICREDEDELNLDGNILILDELRDPGNMGTVIRTAEAFNYNNILLLGDCVDVYNSKVLRATMGSIFRVNIKKIDFDFLEGLKESHTILATALEDDSIDITTMTKLKKHAIIIGNESHGIRKKTLGYAHKKVIIPISKNIDSLNAAMASGICMFYLNLIYSKTEREV